ncbi:hypothetical protein QN397_24015 [Variovorax sp. RTB1]|uniref:hypothetical protein n=1 Tax=Variovorax sp. RTB1 TaxID=3048631 RepID=UPI002B23DF7A|nr:hypothetical protein [Variovorax sp. RTB1]MEB0114350.1 hypothetical protein [Variovorax sp. RTB1]
MINSKGDHYCYLNRAPNGQAPAFESRLVQLLRQQGQAKAPPKQWAAMIRALGQKGVKAAELDDSKILSRLEANEAKSLTKEEVATNVIHGLPTIKEIELSAVHYRSYAHQGGRE